MADDNLWDSVSKETVKDGGEWLYQVDGQVRGPVLQDVLVNMVLKGECNLETLVAREGGEFHPVGRVRTFVDQLQRQRGARDAQITTRRRRIALIAAVPTAAAVAVGGYFGFQQFQSRSAEVAQARQAELQALEEKRQGYDKLKQMGLVSLVSLGRQDEVKIRGRHNTDERPKSRSKAKSKGRANQKNAKAARAKARPNRGGRASAATPTAGATAAAPATEPEEEFVPTCQRDQKEIIGVLRGGLAKINACVEDEKKRDAEGRLPPTLELAFVVRNTGKVVDFNINHRDFKRGALSNCLTRTFGAIKFSRKPGADCPVTIPIRISK